MYIPAWPGLTPGLFFRSAGDRDLPFPLNAAHRTYAYVARTVIYHLIRALRMRPDEVVLVPDYHSGVEVWAIRAAGASVRFYPIRRNLEPDLEALDRLCRSSARVLYVIHFLGWPQPMAELVALSRERGMVLIEDCALALLSAMGGQPLGTFGDHAVFCLYKTLPIPHGGLLVQNRQVLKDLTRLELRPSSLPSLAGRSAELMLEWIRSRADPAGAALSWLKRGAGQALTRAGVRRSPVGDISPGFSSAGFDVAGLNIAMSALCHRLLARFDYAAIRRRRRENFLFLRERLAGTVPVLQDQLAEGVCPLFFPLLVEDKSRVARALRARGIGAVEFWNYGHPDAEGHTSEDARFLRAHVVEVPLHQDLTPPQLEYMVAQIVRLRPEAPGPLRPAVSLTRPA